MQPCAVFHHPVAPSLHPLFLSRPIPASLRVPNASSALCCLTFDPDLLSASLSVPRVTISHEFRDSGLASDVHLWASLMGCRLTSALLSPVANSCFYVFAFLRPITFKICFLRVNNWDLWPPDLQGCRLLYVLHDG